MLSINKNQFLLAGRALLVSVFVLPVIVHAIADSSIMPTNTSTISQKSTGLLSRLSFETGFEYSQRVAEDEQAKREESMDIVMAPAFKINDSYRMSLKTVLTKENVGAKNPQASDTILSLGIQGFELSPSITTVHSISGIFPTSEKSRDQDRLKGGIGFSNGLHYANPLWDITYRLGYTQLFHEFNLNASGSPNMQQSLSHSLGLKYSLTDKFYTSILGIYRWGLTYGKKERSSYELHGDLNYDVSNKMTLNLGTSNAGQALRANGVASNITAYDPDKAVIRAGISISL